MLLEGSGWSGVGCGSGERDFMCLLDQWGLGSWFEMVQDIHALDRPSVRM